MGPQQSLRVYRQSHSLGPAEDLQFGLRLLEGTRRHASGPKYPPATPPLLRIYRPQPTVAFGQRDSRLPGFSAAQQASRDLGFEPVVRRAGGRAAAYTQGSLIVDHIEPDPDPIRESQARFSAFAELYAHALNTAGISARIGPLPDEYCYGEHSVHGFRPDEPDVRVKIIGTAQRQIATGWLFSSSIIVEDGQRIRRVLTDTYSAMGLRWDPLTAGAANDVAPAVTVEQVESAILDAYAHNWDLKEWTPALT
ncbi:lipoate--protein ligase family protein [Nesterenkonia haasae]|uniref:lipoate--protein ligase family protein n=1 Tax=Nesterenkonia haasae TaxID=2587813 RepID=UPI001390F305|nr:lipoate--protein ligase family protein [Nesterenkonia haasae]NDK30572.1 lipoate--protein ligase family protein [Nesterenkonia haasae]